jgi:eukaryotic-like serine/threonine-protein kinase
MRQPLDEALSIEIGRLELLICRVWQVLGAVGFVGGLVLYATSGMIMAAWCALAAVLFLGWYTLEAAFRRRGESPRWMQRGTVVVESTSPWLFMVLITLTQGPAYALGSWVPPLIWAALMVASTARLRPWWPAAISLSGAVVFPVVYFALVRPMLSPAELALPLNQPVMQLSRAFSLAAGGLLVMVISQGLRQAIGKAETAVRERDLFGKYRLERQVASGGMGTVYEATYCPEGGFERRVAIKQIHPHLARTPKFVEAFRSEAELSARLAHPNIVQVLDFGRVARGYFLAMEYVDGLTLSSLMRRLRGARIAIEPRLVAFVGREILAGLMHSHTGARDANGQLLRIVHRDLSPANVLLSHNGEVKISDFGVARALRDAAAAHTKTVVGHVAYTAPEQARALAIDERSDLFSLGVILWELLTGRSLFDRGSEGPTLIALVTDEIPPPSSLRNVAPGWDRLLLRALERDPERRTPSAKTMMLELESLPDAQGGSLGAAGSTELASLVQLALDLPEVAGDDENDREAISQMTTRVATRASS